MKDQVILRSISVLTKIGQNQKGKIHFEKKIQQKIFKLRSNLTLKMMKE